MGLAREEMRELVRSDRYYSSRAIVQHHPIHSSTPISMVPAMIPKTSGTRHRGLMSFMRLPI